MKRKKIVVLLTVGTMLAAASGCGKSEPVADPTPTPAPTATPAPTSTPTPAPTPTVTPAPKMIGKKTAEAKFITLPTIQINSSVSCIFGYPAMRIGGTV